MRGDGGYMYSMYVCTYALYVQYMQCIPNCIDVMAVRAEAGVSFFGGEVGWGGLGGFRHRVARRSGRWEISTGKLFFLGGGKNYPVGGWIGCAGCHEGVGPVGEVGGGCFDMLGRRYDTRSVERGEGCYLWV